MPNGQKRSTHTAAAQKKRMLKEAREKKIKKALKQREDPDLPTKAQIQRRDKFAKLLAQRFKYFHSQLFIMSYPDELQPDGIPSKPKRERDKIRDKFRAILRQREKEFNYSLSANCGTTSKYDDDTAALAKLGLGRAEKCDGEVWLRDKKFDDEFGELLVGMIHPRVDYDHDKDFEKSKEEGFILAKYLTEHPPKVGKEVGDICINPDTGAIYLDLDFRRAPVFSGIDWWLGPLTDKTYHLEVFNANPEEEWEDCEFYGITGSRRGASTMSKRYLTDKHQFKPMLLISDGPQQTEWYPKTRTPCNPEVWGKRHR